MKNILFVLMGFLLSCQWAPPFSAGPAGQGPYGQSPYGSSFPYQASSSQDPSQQLPGSGDPYSSQDPSQQGSSGDPYAQNPSHQGSSGSHFQNPAFPPGPPTSRDNEVSDGRNLDLPYELIPDTLTTVTCNQMASIAGRPFTLVLGAYVNPGLRLSRKFLENQKITKDTPPGQVYQILNSHPHRNARARLALQDESDLRRRFTKMDGTTPLQGFFPPFNNPTTLRYLSEGKAVFSTRSSSTTSVQTSGRFDALLPISGKELDYFAEGLAPDGQGSYMLTVTYTLNGRTSILGDNGLPYGRGYKLQFADFRANYLVSVREDNLVKTQEEGRWNCPDSLKFAIHRANSRDRSPFNKNYDYYKDHVPSGTLPEGYCDTSSNQLSASAGQFFRTQFGTNNPQRLPFYVGKTVILEDEGRVVKTDQPCIIFKRPGCYPQKGFYRIEFDKYRLNDCVSLSHVRANEDYYRLCPAYLSACVRAIE